jgi:hypothetical protein
MKMKKYKRPETFTTQDAEEVILRNDPQEILHVPIWAAMTTEDFEWAQDVCIRLSSHSHYNVRGNAILGFGHLSRRFGKIDQEKVVPIVKAALKDTNKYVRSHAESAADDIEFYTGISIA